MNNMPQKCLYVIGPQSTGKSTIIQALLNETSGSFNISDSPQQHMSVIQEVARKVMADYGFTRDDIAMRPSRALQLQKLILRAQFEAEMTLSSFNEQTAYISDRSGLDPIAYAHACVGPEAAEEMLDTPEWSFLEARMRHGIVVLCEAGMDWFCDDGVRLVPKDKEDWISFNETFRQLLKTRGIGFFVVPHHMNALEDRVSLVKEAWGASKSNT